MKNKEDTTMKKFMTNIKTLAALFIAGAAITACSSDDAATEQKPEQKTYTLVINASKSDDATRALSPGASGINVYWDGTETFDVLDDNIKIGTATADASPNADTKITATLSAVPTSHYLRFYLKGAVWDYTGQVGLLTGTNSISEKYDYAWGTLIEEFNQADGDFIIDGDNITMNVGANLVLHSKQAIVKFTLYDKANNAAINATSLTIHDNNGRLIQTLSNLYGNDTNTKGEITIYPAGTTNVVYAAMAGADYENTLTLTATDGTDTWTFTASGVEFYGGSYYDITVYMTKQAPAAKAAADATAEDKGKLIGTDGNIYADVAAATAAGTTAVAKIIYIGTTGLATYTHGLALALTDEASKMAWQAAIDACSAKNESTPVTGATWLLASQDQWNYMLGDSGAGSHYDLRSDSNLQWNYYWSSTENDSDYAWYYSFAYGVWNPIKKGNINYVRACLAF